MDTREYKLFYDRVGEDIGWDFSKLKCVTEGEKWQFYSLVAERLSNTEIWLDIGIGGGEKVLQIANKSLLHIGIDISKGMLKTAKNNLRNSKLKNVRFMRMDSDKLEFPDGFFDIITTRHCDFNTSEVFRTLKKGGYFLTQQVEFKDKENFKEILGKSQMSEEKESIVKKYIEDFKRYGFEEVKVDYYNAKEYYQTIEDIIFLLKNTPIVPDFGKQETDFEKLNRFIEKYTTNKGIVTNSHRSLIIARK